MAEFDPRNLGDSNVISDDSTKEFNPIEDKPTQEFIDPSGDAENSEERIFEDQTVPKLEQAEEGFSRDKEVLANMIISIEGIDTDEARIARETLEALLDEVETRRKIIINGIDTVHEVNDIYTSRKDLAERIKRTTKTVEFIKRVQPVNQQPEPAEQS